MSKRLVGITATGTIGIITIGTTGITVIGSSARARLLLKMKLMAGSFSDLAF